MESISHRQVPFLAGTLLPGETTSIPFKLQNAETVEAGYTVTSNFQGEGWVSYVTDMNNSVVQMPMPLMKGEEGRTDAKLTLQAMPPGEVPFSLRAVCPSCGGSLFGTDVISKKIEIPVLTEIDIAAEELEISAPANGNSRIVFVDIFNLGNDDESYSLELSQSNYRLQAFLSSDETPVLMRGMEKLQSHSIFLCQLVCLRGCTPQA